MKLHGLFACTLVIAVSLPGLNRVVYAVKLDNVELAGKAIHQVEKRGDQEVEIFAIIVKSATAKDGDAIIELKGKSVTITGPKAEEISKNNGHDVLAFGTLADDKSALEADSVVKIPKEIVLHVD